MTLEPTTGETNGLGPRLRVLSPRTSGFDRERRSFLLILLFCTFGQPACAANADTAEGVQTPALLDPIVAVATREKRPLDEVAANVALISRQDLDLGMAASLDDVFRYVPGIDTASSGTRFGTEGVIIRGIGGNRVALELDGVPLSQHFAVGNFSNATRDLVDIGLLERIEVLHGPASALYGSSALGGVVSMRTPSPSDFGAEAEGRGYLLSQGWRSADESLHTLGAASACGDRVGGLGMVSVRGGHERDAAAAEEPDKQDYHTRSGLAKVVYEDPAGHQLTGLYYGFDSDVETDVRSAAGTGRFRSTTWLEGDDAYRLDLAALEYRMSAPGRPGEATLRAWSGASHIRQGTIDERSAAARPVRIDRRFDYRQDGSGLSLDVRRRFEALSLTQRLAFGLEWTSSRIKESREATETGLDDGIRTATVLGEQFPVRDFPITDVDEIGAYVHDEFVWGKARVIAGLRFDRYDLDPDPDPVYEEDNPATEAVAITEDELSPHLGLVVRITSDLDGWVQYAHGFRGPSFEDANIGLDIPMFNVRAIPNPDLKPETSDGLEAGFRWRMPLARVGASAFYTRYDDFIETKVGLGVDPVSGRLLFQSQNIEEARIYGAELQAEVSLDGWLRGLEVRAAAYWARGENRETDEPLNSVGPAQAVLAAHWATPDGRTTAALLGTFTKRHSRLDESSGDLFEAPGHAVFDVFFSRRWGAHLLVRAGVENLLDRTYWRWADVRGFGPDDPAVPLMSQPGRSLAVNLRWDF